jgi:hypothetical protein
MLKFRNFKYFWLGLLVSFARKRLGGSTMATPADDGVTTAAERFSCTIVARMLPPRRHALGLPSKNAVISGFCQ